VANHDSDDVSMYRVDAAGQLIAQGAAPAGLRPYSVTVDPTGRFAYVANSGSNDVWLYTIEASTGKLTLQGPVASGSGPVAVRAFTPQALQLSVNATGFRGGTTMTLTAAITPGSTPQVVDLYVAVQSPDQTLRFLQVDAGLTPDPRPLVANWTVVPFAGELLRYTFSGGEPSGLYRWLAAFTAPGTVNILGTMAQAPFTFSP
jgi:DNA-binding beta-propeller fold protein YncE